MTKWYSAKEAPNYEEWILTEWYDGNESLYEDDYSKAVGSIGKECLAYLQNLSKEV